MKENENNKTHTNEESMNLYWDVRDQKVDKNLLGMCIASGVYFPESYNEESFQGYTKLFIESARSFKRYKEQLTFILNKTSDECFNCLLKAIIEKWHVDYEDLDLIKLESIA